ncbi:MAG: hypothetical protein V1745_00555 [Patescibacteria group bacterium]
MKPISAILLALLISAAALPAASETDAALSRADWETQEHYPWMVEADGVYRHDGISDAFNLSAYVHERQVYIRMSVALSPRDCAYLEDREMNVGPYGVNVDSVQGATLVRCLYRIGFDDVGFGMITFDEPTSEQIGLALWRETNKIHELPFIDLRIRR